MTHPRLRFAAAASALLLWACATEPVALPPEFAESEYFKTQEATFLAGDDGRFAYVMLLEVLQAPPRGSVVEVWMQNPEPGAAGIQTTIRVRPADEVLTIRSRGLRGLAPGRTYHTTVLLYASPKKAQLLGSHEQAILFAP